MDAYQADLDAVEMAERLFTYWQTPTAFSDATTFLRQNTLPLCIVSNIDTSDLRSACNHNGWEFDFVVTSEECRSYKPRPEMFACALEKLGCRAQEVLHIGDSLSSDVKGAQLVGIDVAWVNRRGRAIPGNMAPPNYTVSALDALPIL
jgi:2-haloacid dehalogenase/putative hydrolase of the HAD superfamily